MFKPFKKALERMKAAKTAIAKRLRDRSVGQFENDVADKNERKPRRLEDYPEFQKLVNPFDYEDEE